MLKINNFKYISKLFWPIALTLLLTNTLAFVDSAMIGNYDISGIAAITAATQVQFLFGPVYFAILMSVSIYTVQYYANKKYDNLKQLSGIALTMLGSLLIFNFLTIVFFHHEMAVYFSPDDSHIISMADDYISLYKYTILLIPIDMFFVYQYRAIKKPKISLILGTMQALMNIVLNLCFIYGIFIFPEWGIKGAAISTFISKATSVSIYILYSYRNSIPFLGSIKEMFSYNMKLFKEVFLSAIPLMIVELLFGIGNVVYLKIYSLISGEQYILYNAAKTISFTINALVMGTSSVAGILSGEAIAKDNGDGVHLKQMMTDIFKFLMLNSFIILIISFLVLPHFIVLFTSEPKYVRVITEILMINGIWMALRVFSSSIIAILKSGNDNRFVLLIDAGGTYLVGIPLTLFVFYAYSPSIVILRSIIIVEFAFKVLIGLYRYRQKKWINKL